MKDHCCAQSVQERETQNEEPEYIIRQDYEVQGVDGQKSVLPNAFWGLELLLAYMRKPDYSKVMHMAGGVSEVFQLWLSSAYHSDYFTPHHICIPTRNADPDCLSDCSLGKPRSCIAPLWLVEWWKQGSTL